MSGTADPALEVNRDFVHRKPAELEGRFRLRAEQMIEQGLVDEVRRIRVQHPDARALGAVGYKEVCAYLDGIPPAGRKIPPGLPGLQQEIELATRQLVKKQRTWFRNLHSKLGEASRWFDMPTDDWQSEFNRLYLN